VRYLHKKDLTILLAHDPVVQPINNKVANVGKGVQDTEDDVIGLDTFDLWLSVGRVGISAQTKLGNLSADDIGV
jgi:hypothetical protein